MNASVRASRRPLLVVLSGASRKGNELGDARVRRDCHRVAGFNGRRRLLSAAWRWLISVASATSLGLFCPAMGRAESGEESQELAVQIADLALQIGAPLQDEAAIRRLLEERSRYIYPSRPRPCDRAIDRCSSITDEVLNDEAKRLSASLPELIKAEIVSQISAYSTEELQAQKDELTPSPIGFGEAQKRQQARMLLNGAFGRVLNRSYSPVLDRLEAATASLPRAPLPIIPRPPTINLPPAPPPPAPRS